MPIKAEMSFTVQTGRTWSTAWAIALGLLCSLGLLLATGPTPAEAKAKCTQKGTNGVDVLKGTKRRDVLCGLGGGDVLVGGKGNDILRGGRGKDVLLGGNGGDRLDGGGGDDSLTGGRGSDTLNGGDGRDGAAFSDAPGPMVIDLPGHKATGIGKDTLSGIDKVIGSPSDDTIIGDAKPNSIYAGSGNDRIVGGGGNDSLNGESGVDSLSYAGSPSGVSGSLVAGQMTGEGNDAISGIETLVGSPHDDNIVGSVGNDTISGGEGQDSISGGGGDDLINGDGGNDKIYGEDANDSLHGDAGDDLVDGGGGVNACDGGTGANTFAGNCDTGAPELSELRINPASVNTFASSQTVVFRVDASDDLAGVDPANSKVVVHTPTGVTRTIPLSVISGTQSAGTFGGQLDLPRYAAMGTYTVDLVLVDNNGNGTTLFSSDLITAGHPGSFEQTGVGDSDAPLVGGLTVAPTSVDTSAQDRSLHFVVHATDDLSGVDANDSLIAAIGPDGVERGLVFLSSGPGTPTDGDITGDIVLPRYSPQGTYTLLLKLVDNAGNEVYTTSQQLISKGYAGSFAQTGAGDTAPPQLLSFTRSPATTDTRENTQSLSISIGASDALAGVDPAASSVVVRDPNGRIDSTTPLTAGGSNTFTASPVLQRGSAPGIWKLDLILYDKAGNSIEFPSARLSQLGFQSTFQNLAVQGT